MHESEFRVLAQHDLPDGGTVVVMATRNIDGTLACDVIELMVKGIRAAEQVIAEEMLKGE
jgi:hypothetical protein